jgi:hypothetical protein
VQDDKAGRLLMEGPLELGLRAGFALHLDEIEVETQGTLTAPRDPFAIFLRGRLEELRKLSEFGKPFGNLLAQVAGEPGSRNATMALNALPPLLARLVAAGRPHAAHFNAKRLSQDPAWVGALFQFGGYEPMAITVLQWDGELSKEGKLPPHLERMARTLRDHKPAP